MVYYAISTFTGNIKSNHATNDTILWSRISQKGTNDFHIFKILFLQREVYTNGYKPPDPHLILQHDYANDTTCSYHIKYKFIQPLSN